MAARDLKRLALYVNRRRTELGLTQEEFAARAGVGDDSLSLKTLQRIELQQIATPRSRTLGAVDRAAGWPAGRARAILDGDDIAPAEPASPPPPERVEPAAATWGDLRRELQWWHGRLRESPEDYERLLYLLDLSAQVEGQARSTHSGVQLDAHG